LAVFYYEYGRALGVTCFFDESETYLKKAYELDKKTNGPVYMSLTELGRLNLDQKKYDQALKYYNEVIPMIEKMGAETEAPMEFSFMLDDYSEMLSNTGMEQKAGEYKQRAEEIRKKNPKRHSITERTMYGTQCTK
jgi:tetratricopeptide (TPR) repeat protein